mmetsp:Transcript_12571/g.14424  ORF Transcript_12571/g.14424 Transcript_12571/m.14424 type:complete len:409 (+) Transcript_12571:201-1427(+)|eukprot:CAMPEP_0184021184 /NCGR_PEP_ID=MMETSP0954-20121128/9776_1 /TAXON_ID=627963 /ORGANISM="Aplanochytrium sp, Strain PBS07" /LENGTH=408 /DNA_ID=CAMNT_0026303153 /DNA_START=150 /DNA_END=1376 /DNA_ORIENTATION=+
MKADTKVATAVEDEEVTQHINGAKCYGILMVLLGVITIGVCFPYFDRKGNIDSLNVLLKEAAPGFATKLNLPLLVIVGGFLTIVGGFVSIIGFYKSKSLGASKSRLLLFVGVLACVAGGALAIYAAIDINNTLANVKTRLESNPSETDFTADEEGILDMITAVFNKCCIEEYDARNYKGSGNALFEDNENSLVCSGTVENPSPPTCTPKVDNQAAVTANCGDANPCDVDYPTIVQTLINSTESLAILDEVLCVCISDNSLVTKLENLIDSESLCPEFRKNIVEEADDREVPTTPFSFGTLIALTEYNQKIGKFAMVGKMLPAGSNWGEEAEDIGFSCGLGYAKGMGYQMYLYIEDTTKILVAAGVGLGAAIMAFSVLIVAFILVGGGSESEEDFYDEGYGDDSFRDEL